MTTNTTQCLIPLLPLHEVHVTLHVQVQLVSIVKKIVYQLAERTTVLMLFLFLLLSYFGRTLRLHEGGQTPLCDHLVYLYGRKTVNLRERCPCFASLWHRPICMEVTCMFWWLSWKRLHSCQPLRFRRNHYDFRPSITALRSYFQNYDFCALRHYVTRRHRTH